MNKRLDIIITHHEEPIFFLDRFIISLGHQSFKDYDITLVVNQNDNFDYKKHIKSRFLTITDDIKINVVKCENKSQSAKRNLGIKSSNNPYILLCDCDDNFSCDNPNGLQETINEIDEETIEYASYTLIETYENAHGDFATLEKRDNEKLVFKKPTSINATTIHGKIFRRKEIEEYNVEFCNDLTMNEEACFTVVMKFISSRMNGLKWHGDPFYVYRRNNNSVTHKCSLYPVKGLDQFITAVFKSELKKSEISERIDGYLTGSMRRHISVDWYHAIMICVMNTMASLKHLPESKELSKCLEDNSIALITCIKSFQDIFGISSEEEKDILSTVLDDLYHIKGYSKDVMIETLNEFNKRFLENSIKCIIN